MVDSLTGSSPDSRTPGFINIALRSADYETEGRIVQSLETRYPVSVTKSGDQSDDDKEYQIATSLKIPLDNVNPGILETINQKAEAYFQAMAEIRRGEADPSAATDETAETPEPENAG